MPPRESPRQGKNADVDEYVRVRATQGVRAAKVGARAPIVDADISWDEVPARRSRRRRPVAAADDWGLAESDGWVARPQPASERSRSTREQGRRERSAQAARDGIAESWEAAHQSPGHSSPPADQSPGDWSRFEDQATTDGSPSKDRSTADWSGSGARSSAEWSPWEDRPEPDRDAEATGSPAAAPDHGLLPDYGQLPDPGPLADYDPPVDGEIRAARINRFVAGSASTSPAVREDIWEEPPSRPGERRTIVITGRGAERSLPSRHRGWEATLPLHERSGFKPDRVALWAVLLGVILLLVAAASSHAATLAAHVAH